MSSTGVSALQRLLAVASLLLVVLPAHAETRALVLASSYEGASSRELYLPNPVVDGVSMVETLNRAGVDDVIFAREPTATDWQRSVERFTARLTPEDIAFVFYAGHGIQYQGANYLLASDGETLIALDSVLQEISSRARGTVVVIDACRNNPFLSEPGSDTLKVRALTIKKAEESVESVAIADLTESTQGLAQVSNLTGLSTVVFFSTEPGNVAEDGKVPGKGSPFARAIARELWKRQSLDEVFRRTAIRVNKSTRGRQSPWRQGDLPFDVYLAGMKSLPAP